MRKPRAVADPHTHHRHVDARTTQRTLWLALLLTAGFAAVEAVAGYFAGSLALISDADNSRTK